MRSEKEIRKIILDFAENDNRVKAVLLNGSRANPGILTDKYQDFDVVFIVNNYSSFIKDHAWTNVFGEKLIWQLPDEMTLGNDNKSKSFGYLMLFKDGNRIDLTLFPKEYLKTDFIIDSLTLVWLDKDSLFVNVPQSSDIDYHICKPTEKMFLETCNEFWWVSTYVAKGLLRNEITYAKEMLDIHVRPMFMKLIEWKIGIDNDFAVPFGKAGKFMKKYLPDEYYSMTLKTYSNFDIENNWQSLFIMIELFVLFSNEIADKLNFQIDKVEQENLINYLKNQYNGQKKRH